MKWKCNPYTVQTYILLYKYVLLLQAHTFLSPSHITSFSFWTTSFEIGKPNLCYINGWEGTLHQQPTNHIIFTYTSKQTELKDNTCEKVELIAEKCNNIMEMYGKTVGKTNFIVYIHKRIKERFSFVVWKN
jgi:hypothetical protein